MRKGLILPILIATVFMYFGYIFAWNSVALYFISTSDSDLFDFLETDSRQTCVLSSSINYLSYVDINENAKTNNKFGLYIYAENQDFFEIAQKLVNSNGGEWGYVLIPYNIKDRDASKWGRAFRLLREKKLIPIIQLHDVDPDNYKEQTKGGAEFLNQFLWPVKERYVSIYNEPNDSAFWHGRIDPEEYAEIMRYTIAIFNSMSPDYFMLNGALNVSASNNATSMDSFEFMRRMNNEIPGIFDELDGWASHSYPQPNFSGSPDAEGRWSIKAYENELEFLKDELGVKKDLPVFITETGWAHAEGETYNGAFLNSDQAAENIKRAFEKVWLRDERVRAVTPFTIWYDPPFDHFSWVNKDKVPYKQYEVVKSIKKVKGKPSALVVFNENSVGCENVQ